MNNNLISRIALGLYALVLLVFGFGHFFNGVQMSLAVPHYFPFPVFWVYLTGAGLVLAAISFIINKQVKIAAYLLGAMLLIFVLTIYVPGMATAKDDMARWQAFGNLLKDLAMAAGALYIGSKN